MHGSGVHSGNESDSYIVSKQCTAISVTLIIPIFIKFINAIVIIIALAFQTFMSLSVLV
jgi:hypothetical protein